MAKSNTGDADWVTMDRSVDSIVDCILPHHEDFDTYPNQRTIACELQGDLWKLELRTVETIATALRTMITITTRDALRGTTMQPAHHDWSEEELAVARAFAGSK